MIVLRNYVASIFLFCFVLFLTGCVTPPKPTVTIRIVDDNAEKSTARMLAFAQKDTVVIVKNPVNATKSSPNEATVSQCPELFVLPELKEHPDIPNIDQQMRDRPDQIANILLDHVIDLQNFSMNRRERIENSYQEYLENCQ